MAISFTGAQAQDTRRESTQPGEVRVLVMLPALNEAKTIGEVIARIPKKLDGVGRIEVLVVDDGSTDDTVKIVRAAGGTVISHGFNRGVGAALQTALEEAIARRVDVAVNMDADGQFRPEDIEKLVRPILEGHAEMVTASRFADPRLVPRMPTMKRLGNRGMSWLLSWLVGQRFADVSCGFRAYSREALLRLVLTGAFTYTQETFLVLASKGMRIQEVPLEVRGEREHGKSRVASNLWRYAARTSAIIFGSIRDHQPHKFFNVLAAGLIAVSGGVGGFFLWYRFTHGQFSPHIWAGFVSAFAFGIGIVVFALGQVALMLAKLRRIQEDQLYLLRKLDSGGRGR